MDCLPRLRPLAVSLATALCATTLAACDPGEVTLDAVNGDEQADGGEQVVEPTGQVCSPWETPSAECSDGSTAYCSYMPGSGESEFGPCLAVDEVECEPGDWEDLGPRSDEFMQEACGNRKMVCNVYGGVPTWEEEECNTPLVLSFDQSPVEMVPAEATPAATFDISMTASSCISTDWPTAATPWLAVDLDGSGTIDGGRELFGSGTRIGAAGTTRANDGFVALASFDANGDGTVDHADPRFSELLLWRDVDGDRRSTPDELESLASAGIDALPVESTGDGTCDDRGNCSAIGGTFGHAGGVGRVFDVVLSCQ